uniref:Secreted protein n=1 Tax=Knipowitschia caucasica TaxID=637954 RepID=A0AAV2JQW1_KNICA
MSWRYVCACPCVSVCGMYARLLSGRIGSVVRAGVRLSAPLLPIDALFKRLRQFSSSRRAAASECRRRPITMPLQSSEEAVYGAAALITLMN